MRKTLLVLLSVLATSFITHAVELKVGNLLYTVTSTVNRTLEVSNNGRLAYGNLEIPSAVSYNNVTNTVTKAFIESRSHIETGSHRRHRLHTTF